MSSTGTRKIMTEGVSIRTAAVEIKALMVDNKQMTLAVFRQLEREPFLDEFAEPQGIAWGRVNYHPDKCEQWSDDPLGDHVHIVWQKGDELRRDAVYERGWRPRAMLRGLAKEGRERLAAQWEVEYRDLLSLGQLFIAV